MFLTSLDFARPQLVACFGLFLTKDLRRRRKSGCCRNKSVLAFSLKASEMWDSLVEEHQWVMEVVAGVVLQRAPLELSKKLPSGTGARMARLGRGDHPISTCTASGANEFC